MVMLEGLQFICFNTYNPLSVLRNDFSKGDEEDPVKQKWPG